MDMLTHLREMNPALPLFSVNDPEFSPYGRVIKEGCPELFNAMSGLEIPQSGNIYVASDSGLEALGVAGDIRRSVFGDMDVECGYCNGNGYKLNAMEYHKGSEVNYSSRGLVLLLAQKCELEDGRLDSRRVKGFYLPADTLIEIYPTVLHFAPCRVLPEGFDCLVVLERGVNSPLDRVDTAAPGEDGMLWMRGKWLLCHQDSPQAKKGAYIGIYGENTELRI